MTCWISVVRYIQIDRHLSWESCKPVKYSRKHMQADNPFIVPPPLPYRCGATKLVCE